MRHDADYFDKLTRHCCLKMPLFTLDTPTPDGDMPAAIPLDVEDYAMLFITRRFRE